MSLIIFKDVFLSLRTKESVGLIPEGRGAMEWTRSFIGEAQIDFEMRALVMNVWLSGLHSCSV